MDINSLVIARISTGLAFVFGTLPSCKYRREKKPDAAVCSSFVSLFELHTVSAVVDIDSLQRSCYSCVHQHSVSNTYNWIQYSVVYIYNNALLLNRDGHLQRKKQFNGGPWKPIRRLREMILNITNRTEPVNIRAFRGS